MGGNNLPLVLLGEAQKNIKRDTTQLPQPQIKRVLLLPSKTTTRQKKKTPGTKMTLKQLAETKHMYSHKKSTYKNLSAQN